MVNNTDGHNNVALGHGSLYNNKSGYDNIAVRIAMEKANNF
jgi:hypothetical protein